MKTKTSLSRSPVAKNLHKAHKPSRIEHKKEKLILEALDEEIKEGNIEPIPSDLLCRMREIQKLAKSNIGRETASMELFDAVEDECNGMLCQHHCIGCKNIEIGEE